MAGLLGSKACVGVAPWFNCNGPSSGAVFKRLAAGATNGQLLSLIKLRSPFNRIVGDARSQAAAVLSAMMLFSSSTVALGSPTRMLLPSLLVTVVCWSPIGSSIWMPRRCCHSPCY